jgi:hypothetical protein
VVEVMQEYPETNYYCKNRCFSSRIEKEEYSALQGEDGS